jgi:hypothetical protein
MGIQTSTPFRRRIHARTTVLAGMLLAGTLIAGMPLEVAASTGYGTNLVKNGGAESGLTHWDTFLNFKTHKYGASGSGYPSTHASNNIGGGTRFFTSGQYDDANGACPEAEQTILLTGIGSAIDNGHVKVHLSVYAGTNGASDINAHVRLLFRTSGSPHSVSGNDFHRKASSTGEHYKHLSASKILSRHTRTLILKLQADGESTVTGGCQAFWDKVSVKLEHV